MKVEREIAWAVLPYALGTAISVYLGAAFLKGPGIYMIAFMTAVSIITLLYPYARKHLTQKRMMVLIIPAFFLTGIMSGVSGMELSYSDIDGTDGIRHRFCCLMKEAIHGMGFRDPDNASILEALLTGDKTSLSRETVSTFRNSGASHILALSGFHLGIVYSIIRNLLKISGNSHPARSIRAITCITFCTAYTLATGAGPSITRALIFITLREISVLTCRNHDTPGILMGALLIQLTLSPLSITSAGFQLSYAAMAGIAFIYPAIKGLWPEDNAASASTVRPVRWIWNSLALSLACQITTGPLAYLYFHTFPQHFLLTNLIAIPLTGLLIPVSLAALSTHLLGLDIEILTKASETLISALSHSLEIIAEM